jgi:peptide-methionine (R)-S-oxide reductase
MAAMQKAPSSKRDVNNPDCLRPDKLAELCARKFVVINLSMNKIIRNSYIVVLAFVLQCCTYSQSSNKQKLISMDNTKNNPLYSRNDSSKVNLSNEEWKKILPRNIYEVARGKGTERPWSSPYENSHEIGTYYCAVCGNPLFRSDTKFESGCGWPSFYEPVSKESILYDNDNSFGIERTEVMCGRCKSHLGHVFKDGPPPTGLRYCINGVVLEFEKAKAAERKYDAEKKNPS